MREAGKTPFCRWRTLMSVAVWNGAGGQPPAAPVAQVPPPMAGVEDHEIVVLGEILAEGIERRQDLRVLRVQKKGDLETILIPQQRLHGLGIVFRRGDGRQILVLAVADDQREETPEASRTRRGKDLRRRGRRGHRDSRGVLHYALEARHLLLLGLGFPLPVVAVLLQLALELVVPL